MRHKWLCSLDMERGQKIAGIIESLGWSDSEAARRVGVSQQTISRWKGGASIKLGDALRLARALGVSLDYLADDAMDAPPEPPPADLAVILDLVRTLGTDIAKRRLLQVPEPSPATTPGPHDARPIGSADRSPHRQPDRDPVSRS